MVRRVSAFAERALTSMGESRKMSSMKGIVLFALCLINISLFAEVKITLAPNGGADMTAKFMAAVEKARKAQKTTILLKPGEYHFSSPVKSEVWVSNHDNPRPRNIFLPIQGVTNLSVRCYDGTARFVCDGNGIALALIDTKHVIFEGVAFDYVRPFFSIHHLKNGKLELDQENFPSKVENGTLFSVGRDWKEKQIICEMFDKDTRQFREAKWWNGSIDHVFAGHPDGTIAMTRNAFRPNPCVFLYRAEVTGFKRCGAYAAAGMGFIAQRSKDIILEEWRTRGERPLALQADATHFSNCRGKIIVSDGVFEGMVDDAINVHSTSLKIIEKKGADTIVCRYVHKQSVGFETFLAGETLRFIKGATFEPGDEVKVVSAKMLSFNTVELKLATKVPEKYGVGDAVENADWQPAVVFMKNTVRNSNPRATLFTTPKKVLCEDNLFENVAGQPIYFAGDAWNWYESGASRNVIVKGNTFRHCGFKSGLGMIQIEPAVHDLNAQKEPYHRNILVEDNVFEDFKLPLVWARSAENVRLRSNKIVNGNTNMKLFKADVKIE